MYAEKKVQSRFDCPIQWYLNHIYKPMERCMWYYGDAKKGRQAALGFFSPTPSRLGCITTL